MELLNRFKTRWEYLTAPTGVERELAWRGYVLNTLLLGLIFFSVSFFILNFSHWMRDLDDGTGALASLGGGSVFAFIFWVSRKKSVPVAILLFSSFGVALSYLLSFGWGVADITTSVFYVIAIIQTSFLLQRWPFVVLSGTLLIGYLGIGWAELNGWFTPPFYTELIANHVNLAVSLLFLTFLGYITSRLIDRVLAAQIAEAARRQELESRTRIAIEVQMSMLPAQAPTYAGFEIVGQSIPARDVGGDFYAYHQLANDDLAIVIGDVTGKGMPAALLMAVTTGMIDSLIPTAVEPTDLLLVATTRLQKHSQRSGMNAACLAAFLKKNGELCAANAGCIAPIIRRTNGQLEWLDIRGLPIGVASDLTRYKQAETILTPGDMVIFTTDGVVEAQDESNRLLGFETLEAIITSGPSHSAEAMKLHIFDKVEAHRGPVEQNDDVTVVVVRVKEDLSLSPSG